MRRRREKRKREIIKMENAEEKERKKKQGIKTDNEKEMKE